MEEKIDNLAWMTDEEYDLFKRETLRRLSSIQVSVGHPLLVYVTNAGFGVMTDMETGEMIYTVKGE